MLEGGNLKLYCVHFADAGGRIRKWRRADDRQKDIIKIAKWIVSFPRDIEEEQVGGRSEDEEEEGEAGEKDGGHRVEW